VDPLPSQDYRERKQKSSFFSAFFQKNPVLNQRVKYIFVGTAFGTRLKKHCAGGCMQKYSNHGSR
jgi:hypothetical protein